MSNSDSHKLSLIYESIYIDSIVFITEEEAKANIDQDTQKKLQELITKLIDKVYASPDDQDLIGILQQLEKTTDPKQQLQVLQQAKQLQDKYLVDEGLFDKFKAAGKGIKAGAEALKQNVTKGTGGNVKDAAKQAYQQSIENAPKEDFNSKLKNFKTNIGRLIAELDRDMSDMKFNAKEYPQLAQSLKNIKQSLQSGDIKSVDTKWDRFTHGVGKFVGGAITNAAIFGGLNAVMSAVGLNPYVAKSISGAASSVLRDIRKGNTKDKKGMLKRALIGAGIGAALQLGSEVMNPTILTTKAVDQNITDINGWISSGEASAEVASPGTFGTKIRALFDGELKNQMGLRSTSVGGTGAMSDELKQKSIDKVISALKRGGAEKDVLKQAAQTLNAMK